MLPELKASRRSQLMVVRLTVPRRMKSPVQGRSAQRMPPMCVPLLMKAHTRTALVLQQSPLVGSAKWRTKGYFVEGDARAPREETTLELADDETVVFEDFFVAGIRMPLHPALANILLKFQAQLHQLTPNAIAQLYKYF
jgi:hypothetical protein